MILYGTPSQQFVYRDNLTIRGSKGYGVFGDGFGEGTVALRKYAADGVFRNNVLTGADNSLSIRKRTSFLRRSKRRLREFRERRLPPQPCQSLQKAGSGFRLGQTELQRQNSPMTAG